MQTCEYQKYEINFRSRMFTGHTGCRDVRDSISVSPYTLLYAGFSKQMIWQTNTPPPHTHTQIWNPIWKAVTVS